MSDNIVIQNISEQDLDEIVKIGLSTPELHLSDKNYYYDQGELASFIKSPNDIFLVAKIDGQIAGYRLATFNPYLREAYLMDIVVKPEFRNLGIANKLYEETFKILNKKKCQWAWALVKSDNYKMVEILSKKGFRQGSLFKAFYKVGPF